MTIVEFGTASLVLSFVYFAVSLQRSGVGDPLLIFAPKHSYLPQAAARWVLVDAAAVLVGMVALVWIYPQLYPVYLSFVGGLLVAQDGLRYGLVALNRRSALLLGDVLWLITAALLLFLASVANLELSYAFAVWIALSTGTVCMLFLSLQTRRRSAARMGSFLRATSAVSGWAALQFILSNGAVQAALTLFAIGVGTTNFAGFRATQMVLSPLIVGTLAISSPLLSLIVRRGEGGWSRRRAFSAAAALAAIMAIVGTVVVWQGRELIELIPGSQYAEFSGLLLPGTISLIFVAANVPIASTLLSLVRGRVFFWASAGATIPTSALVAWAAFAGGVELAAWMMVVQYAVITGSCGIALWRVHPVIGDDR